MKNNYIIFVLILVVIISVLLILKLYIKNKMVPNTLRTNNEIVLKTNGGVPYTWEYSIDDESIIQLKEKRIEGEKDKKIAGGVILEHYVFKSIKPGITTIKFTYRNFTNKSIANTKKYKVVVNEKLELDIIEMS